jgi:CRP/FNR family transcriptional regulator
MLTIMEVVIALRHVPLFASVQGEGLKRLADVVLEKKVAAGELIFAEHDLGEEVYLVHSGAIQIFQLVNGRELPIDMMRKGSYFGELAIIDELPRSASARALEDSVLLVLSKHEFRTAVQDYPDIALEALKELSRRLRNTDLQLRALAEQVEGTKREAS